jgi:hypothetical protein
VVAFISSCVAFCSLKYVGLGRACKMQALAFAGLAWPGLRARGLECRLSPKSRPMRARSLGLCSGGPSPQVGLGPGPDLALL